MRLSLDSRARRLLRRLPVVNVYSALELLLLSLLALQCARLLWAAVTPVGPVGDWKVPGLVRAQPMASLTLGEFDPFFRLQAGTAPVVVTSLAIQLFGVRVNRATGGGSAILATPDGVQSSFAVGETIVPGVTLAAVHEDGVSLRRGGVQEQLFLDQSVPAANVAPGTVTAPPAGAFAPRLVGGQVSGLNVTGSPGPVLEAAGIRAGDIIVSLNGAAISGAADAQQLASGLTPGSRVTVGVERGGRIVPIAVEVPAR